jgi:hypothetical protein
MPGISNAIAIIRSCVGSMDLTLTNELREAAEVYADACRQVNERLARCEQLLRQGLRAEAIRQAEIDPDLLEIVGELDFDGRDQWEERLTLNDVQAPPAINLKALELLNRAYADEAPLAELLKHYRLQALGRAPLRERMETVRLLAKAEPANVAWTEDVAIFEAARMDEMRAELRQVRQNNDWPGVRALSAEVLPGKWKTFLPLELASDVESEYKRLARLDAQQKFKTHRNLFQQAAAEFNLDRCRQIRSLIERISRERQIERDDVLLEPLRSLLEWLTEQERLAKETRQFEKACRDLTDAIGQKVSLEAVQNLYQGILNYKRPVPKDVENAYQSYLSATRRSRVRIAVFFAIALLLMVGLFGGVTVLFIIMGR